GRARRPRGPAHRAQATARRPRAPRRAGRGGRAGRAHHVRLGHRRPRPPRAVRGAAPRQSPAVRTGVEIAFWVAVALLVYAQVGYPLLLAALDRVAGHRPQAPPAADAPLPEVSLIVAAYNEAAIIEGKLR